METYVRVMLWILIIGLISVAFLVCCTPVHSAASVTKDFETDTTPQYNRMCDDVGVCCYRVGKGNPTCVATKVEIIVSPGEINEGSGFRKESQRDSETKGEVSSRAIEARLVKQLNGGRITP